MLVLTPLLEEAALGCRLLPSAAAAAAAAAGDEGSHTLPLCVPRAVRISGALARLRTAEVHGVHLASSVDAGRWSPYPLPVAAEAEEGARQLSAWRELFHFELRKPEPGRACWACGGGEEGVVHTQACFTLLTEPDQEPDPDHEHG